MSQFIKFVFASCLGIVLFTIAVIGVFTLIGVASGGDSAPSIKPNSVLELNFDAVIPELTDNLEKDPFDLEQKKIIGLQDIVKTIKAAKDDNNIKGILLYPKGDMGGLASTESVRNAIKEFREEGKFVVSYATMYSQSNYYLASTADEIFIHPMGFVDFRGFAATIPFFKEMLDDIGVKFDVFYAGDFKSATEPVRRTEISEPNRLQTRAYLTEVYDNFVGNIQESRDISRELIVSTANNLSLKNAEKAIELGFADKIAYRDEVIASLQDRLGLDDDEDIKTVSLGSYFASIDDDSNYSAKEKVAVIYAEGTIVGGKGEPGETGDARYVPIIEKLRNDDKVKAIVLRVNSGGGSALASENMWRELKLTQAAGKKIVVSMGDYAASGGYYIACAADSIFAEPQTITGSIGVFSMIPIVKNLMNDKLGIRFDTVSTARYAGGFNPALGLSEAEGNFFQGSVDELYERFLKRVGDARGMTRDEAHAVAQGRVWTGKKALQLGLVDKLGGLDDAINSVAGLAGLESYRVVNYPKPKDQIQQIVEQITGKDKDDDPIIKAFAKELKAFGIPYDDIKMMQEARQPQFLLPFRFHF